MSESLWASETEVDLEPQPEVQVLQPEPHQTHHDAIPLAVSAVDFSALEERVLRAVELVKSERLARAAAEARTAQAEERAARAEALAAGVQDSLHRQEPLIQQLQAELTALKSERDTVRQRVERLLAQLDSLEL